jgi:hypothetical protein
MAPGRSNESRTATIGTTSGSAAITGAAGTFNEEDAGRAISGTGIPAAATIASVTSGTAATMSANATATNASTTATIGGGATDGTTYGFRGWSPETDAESETYTVAAVNAGAVPPDRITNTTTPIARRVRT